MPKGSDGSLAKSALMAFAAPKPMEDEPSTGDGPGMPDDGGDGSDEGFNQVAEQAFEALKGDDVAGFKDALKACMEAVMSEGSGQSTGY